MTKADSEVPTNSTSAYASGPPLPSPLVYLAAELLGITHLWTGGRNSSNSAFLAVGETC